MRAAHIRVFVLSTVYLTTPCVFTAGTVRAQSSCSVTLAPRVPAAAQIFSIQQERILGDIEAEWVESNYHATHGLELEAHLKAIAGRVLSQFSRDQALVHVILIDAPEAQSFSAGPE